MDLADTYHHLTDQFLILSGWSDKMAHLNAGLAIYVLAQLVLRTRRASLAALAAVAGIELGNEVLDTFYYGELRVAESMADIAYTLAWPAIITLVGQYRRERWSRSKAKRAEAAASPSAAVKRLAA